MSKAPETPAPEGDRIAKILARAGVASRREAERLIEEGRVNVNGKPIDSPALNVTAKDSITVDGKPLAEPEPARLWLYHKPAGLVTTARDEQGRETIFDTLPEELPRVISIGRLDLNSEGLLLLTNDGGLKRQLELPSTGWLRRYRVRINGRPADKDFDVLRKGVVIEGEKFQPMIVSIDRQQGANAWLTVGLREGRNREIRRAMEAAGFTVNRLIRISYGPFQLGNLKPGEVEEVRRRVLRDQLGLEAEAEPEAQPSGAPRPARGGKPAPKAGAKPRDHAGERRESKPGERPRGRSGDTPYRKPESGAKRPPRDERDEKTNEGRPPRKFTAKTGGKPWDVSGDRRDDRKDRKPASTAGKRPPRGAGTETEERSGRTFAARPGGKPASKYAPKSGSKPWEKSGAPRDERGGDRTERKPATPGAKRPSRGGGGAAGETSARKFTPKPAAKFASKSTAKPGQTERPTGGKSASKSGGGKPAKPSRKPDATTAPSGRPPRSNPAANPGASLRGHRPGKPKRG
ncbi:MAG: pseudouridine synthase [Pseudodonghicola sp.]